MDKVAKTQMAQREGAAVQQTIQGMELQRKTEAHIQEVNESQNMGEGTQKVKDRGPQGQEKDRDREKDRAETPEEEDGAGAEDSVFRDPSLGRNIDISL
jgi:hypothetical protein